MLPVYVLSDQYGERFLLQTYFDDGETPQPNDSLKNYKYIIYDGKYYTVSFKGVQLGDKEKNSGRDTYYNFDNLSGWLYEMQEGKLLENPENEYDAIWDAALLVDENYKNTSTILDLKNRENGMTKVVALSDDLQKAFENKYGRKIMTSCASAVFGDNSEYQLVNVQFENKDDDASAYSDSTSLALALSPRDAQYLALAQQEGKISVILRSHGDVTQYIMEIATFEKLFNQ